MIGVSFGSLLGNDGFYWIFTTAFVAGVVRGFSGFESAMVSLPLEGHFFVADCSADGLNSFGRLWTPISCSQSTSRYTKPDLLRLTVAMIVAFPLALWLLTRAEPAIFRYLVSIMALFLIISLLFKLRYKGHVRPRMLYGIGVVSGLTGGFWGMPGPPVISFYLSGAYSAAVMRATMLLLLFTFDIVFLFKITVTGQIKAEVVALGLVMAVPIMVGNILGARF